MGGISSGGGLRRAAFLTCVATIVALVAAQSVVHLVLTLGAHRVGTVFDLDRNNSVPDIVSTVALGSAAAGATVAALRERSLRRNVAWMLALALAALTVADILHDGAHPATIHGKIVVGLVCLTAALLVVIGGNATRRVQMTLALAGCALAGAFVVTGLDRLDPWFARERGDPVGEYEIVAKEAFELLGWSLVALALWDTAAGVAIRLRRTDAPRTVPAIEADHVHLPGPTK